MAEQRIGRYEESTPYGLHEVQDKHEVKSLQNPYDTHKT